MMNHTPGPWRITRHNGIPHAVMAPDPDLGGYGVCLIVVGREHEANARLIAAAPELLEAVRKATQLASIARDWNLDEVEIDGEMVNTLDLNAEFDAALAKAGVS